MVGLAALAARRDEILERMQLLRARAPLVRLPRLGQRPRARRHSELGRNGFCLLAVVDPRCRRGSGGRASLCLAAASRTSMSLPCGSSLLSSPATTPTGALGCGKCLGRLFRRGGQRLALGPPRRSLAAIVASRTRATQSGLLSRRDGTSTRRRGHACTIGFGLQARFRPPGAPFSQLLGQGIEQRPCFCRRYPSCHAQSAPGRGGPPVALATQALLHCRPAAPTAVESLAAVGASPGVAGQGPALSRLCR